MKQRGRLAARVGFVLALVLAAAPRFAAAQVEPQAWVPGQGHGSFTVAAGNLGVHAQLLYNGDKVHAGDIYDKIAFLGLDYGLTDRFAVTLGIPFIEKKYEGNRPHRPQILANPDDRDIPFLDDGEYHGGWQDFGLKLRYNLVADPVSITPFLALNTPSHDYVYFAQAAIGTQQSTAQIGIDIGTFFEPPFQNLYVQGGYGYTFVEQVRSVNVNFSTFRLELGYLMSPQWTVRLLTTAQKGHGGLDFPKDFHSFTDDQWLHHDQIERTDFVNMGLSLGYQWSDAWSVSGTYGRTLWGQNSYEINHAVTLGVTRSF